MLLLLLLLLLMELLSCVMDTVGCVPIKKIIDLCTFNIHNPTRCSTTANIIFWFTDVLVETPRPLRTHSLFSIPFSSLSLLLCYFKFVLIYTAYIYSKCLLVVGQLLLARTQIMELKFYYYLVTESHLPGCFNTLGSEWK